MIKEVGASTYRSNTTATLTLSFFAIVVAVFTILNSTLILSSTLSSAVEAVSCLLCLGLTVLSRNRISIVFIILFILSIFVIVINRAPYMIAGTMMLSILEILSTMEVDVSRVLKTFVITLLFGFIFIVVLNRITGFGSYELTIWRIDRMISRQSLGFGQPNTATLVWLAIVIAILGVIRNHYRLVTFFLMVTTLYLYTFTQSRTSTYIIIVTCLVVFLFPRQLDFKLNPSASKIVAIFPIVMVLISFALLLMSSSDLLNKFVSGRIDLYKGFYAQYGIHFLRNPALEDAMFDNSYLQALLSKGILYTIELIALISAIPLMKNRLRMRDVLLILMYLSVAIMETSLQHFELFLPLVLSVSMKTQSNFR